MLRRLNRPFVSALPAILFGAFVWFGPGLKGNDTGGIIAWTPGVEDYALAMATDHCARYGKYSVITSVRPWPGDYIGFVCRRPWRKGPVYN
jgi:hypothetical protein